MAIEFSFDLIPATLSIAGAFLVARYDRFSGLGWALWLLSNGLWIAWAVAGWPDGEIHKGTLLQSCIFSVTSVQGLLRWRAQQINHTKTPDAP